MPNLSYGGHRLLHLDKEGLLADWIATNLSLEDLRDQAPPTAIVNNEGDRGCDKWKASLQVPNYPPPISPRINQLYWPTGASRWASGYFLTDETTKKKIVRDAWESGGNTPLKLKVDYNQPGDKDLRMSWPVFEANLYLLPPRPITCLPASDREENDEGLWLLPLVDERYWWQWRPATAQVTTSTTWANLISSLASDLGASVSADSIGDAYLQPDPTELTRQYESAAVALDAVCHSVGLRVVRSIGGTVSAQSFSSAKSAISANLLADNWRQIAGNPIDRDPVPASVTVAFPKICYRRPHDPTDLKTYQKGASSEQTTTTSGTTKPIRSTCWADFSLCDTSPDNDSELDALATQIAIDFYGWLDKLHDRQFQGVMLWNPTGYDDHVLWNFGRQLEATPASTGSLADDEESVQIKTARIFEPNVCTRVQSVAPNFGIDAQLSQDPGVTPAVCDEHPVVQVWDTGESIATSISANADGYHPGRVRSYSHADGMEIWEDCWIRFVDYHDVTNGDLTVPNQQFYLAFWAECCVESESTKKPLYLARRGCPCESGPCEVLIYREAGTTGAFTAETDLDLDTVDSNEGSLFSVSSGEVTVLGNGTVEATLDVTIEVDGTVTTNNISVGKIKHAISGESYTDPDGNAVFIPHVNVGDGSSSGNKTITLDVSNGDTIKATVARHAGSDSLITVAGQSFLRLKPCGNFVKMNPLIGLVACFEPSGSPGDDQTNTIGQASITLEDTGSVGRGTGKVHAASWTFNGSNQRYDADFPEVDMSGEWTFETWVKVDTFGGDTVFQVNNGSQFLGAVSLQTSSSGGNHFVGVSSSDEGVATMTAGSSLSTGVWYHVIITHDGAGNVEMYLNGSSEDTGSLGGTTNMEDGTESLAVGGDGNSLFFDGELDGTRIYSRKLAAYEASNNYASGSGTACG